MPTNSDLTSVLANVSVDPAVFALRPDYRAIVITADQLAPGESDDRSDAMLSEAEAAAVGYLAGSSASDLPHAAAWREAYKAFGAKPQRTRNSFEALVRRVEGGLPRINRLTDVYNAVSVVHQLPIGGEDLATYVGSPRLLRAVGDESFDTVAGGENVIEQPLPGEVIWADDAGVTCRIWNWRQCRRTQLQHTTTSALFILDALEPMSDTGLHAAADDLLARLATISPDMRAESIFVSIAGSTSRSRS